MKGLDLAGAEGVGVAKARKLMRRKNRVASISANERVQSVWLHVPVVVQLREVVDMRPVRPT